MKKILVLAAIAVTSFSIQAKDILHENVPAKVREYVSKNYPKVNHIEWDDKSSKGYYEAEFTFEGREVELDITADGKLLSSKEDILIKDIPSFASKYIKENYSNAEILGANKKVKNGSTSYSVGIRFDNNQGYQRHRNIVFDNKGNVIKK